MLAFDREGDRPRQQGDGKGGEGDEPLRGPVRIATGRRPAEVAIQRALPSVSMGSWGGAPEEVHAANQRVRGLESEDLAVALVERSLDGTRRRVVDLRDHPGPLAAHRPVLGEPETGKDTGCDQSNTCYDRAPSNGPRAKVPAYERQLTQHPPCTGTWVIYRQPGSGLKMTAGSIRLSERRPAARPECLAAPHERLAGNPRRRGRPRRTLSEPAWFPALFDPVTDIPVARRPGCPHRSSNGISPHGGQPHAQAPVPAPRALPRRIPR